jgi:hypothetical protein
VTSNIKIGYDCLNSNVNGRQRGVPASWNPGGLPEVTQKDWDGVEQLGRVSTAPAAMARQRTTVFRRVPTIPYGSVIT